jgi:tripartite-type tricarboxylate transporter receptor subunit TctC
MRKMLAACLGILLLAGAASAQDAYPSKPITLVMPYAVGGGADLMARALADSLRKSLGQPVTVLNVVGAGSIVGTRQVAHSQPDGYTLLMNHIGLSTAPALFQNLGFDPVKSFEPIGLFSEIPMLLVGGKHLPANDARELADYVRKKGDKVTVASSGQGSGTHLCAMLFEKAAGAKVTMVQYKGSAPAYQDIITGRVDLMCDSTGGSVAPVKSGLVKPYLVTGNRRLVSLPDVPTPAEVGLKDLAAMTVWYALWAPAGTPKPIVDRLSGALQAATRDPTVVSHLAAWDARPFDAKFAVPSALNDKMTSQIAMWGHLIRDAGITPQ